MVDDEFLQSKYLTQRFDESQARDPLLHRLYCLELDTLAQPAKPTTPWTPGPPTYHDSQHTMSQTYHDPQTHCPQTYGSPPSPPSYLPSPPTHPTPHPPYHDHHPCRGCTASS